MQPRFVCLGPLLLVCLASNAIAQQPAGAAVPKATPTITAAATAGSVRFSSGAGVCQIRMQVLGSDGVPLFDSAWKDGDVLDWAAETAGQPLTSGTYRCVVMVKDLDGRIEQREATLNAQSGRISLEPRDGTDALTIVDTTGAAPKITVLAHDGVNGSIVSTGGDLSFRFGNFLAAQDSEKMRLTSDGKLGIGTDKPRASLDVAGMIRTANGIQFADGTILTSVGGQLTTQQSQNSGPDRNGKPVGGSAAPATPLTIVSAARPTPRTNTVTPRFITTDTGVGIWNETPAYKLDVGGDINGYYYRINGDRVLSAYLDNVIVGVNAGAHTSDGQTNVFVGAGAGYTNTSGSNNVFIGKSAGYTSSGATDNVAVGFIAGNALTSGGGNAFFGSTSGNGASTGYGNTFIGANTGASTTTEMNNTVLGAAADTTPGISNATAIGYRAKAAQSNTIVLGSIWGVNSATATCSVGVGTQTPNQQFGVGGGITVDANNGNIGTVAPNTVIAFGTAGSNAISGEAIGSQRGGTGNLYGLDFYTYFAKRMTITQVGRIGIGVDNPTYADFQLAVGKVGISTGWYTWSSAALKNNIRTIDSAVEKTQRLRGVSFDYKEDGAPSLGFLAEEVAQVVPEAVLRDPDANPVGVDYSRITPLLVEAVKEQQKVIEDLKDRIAKLEAAQGSR